VIEWSEGGTYDLETVRVKCLPCHTARQGKEPDPGSDDASAA
jgi:hypothetical protein